MRLKTQDSNLQLTRLIIIHHQTQIIASIKLFVSYLGHFQVCGFQFSKHKMLI